MDQILHDLLKTNDPPSNDIIQLIRGILSEPRRQLEVVKADIQRLEEIQANLEATIHRYDPILSPVRRIPPDILSTIFMYCLPMDRNPDMRASECPMLLTRVCSAWRSLALSFPRLWTQIHIPYLHLSTIPPRFLWEDAPIQDDVDFGQSSAPASQLIETLRRRCEGVQEWLTRSGECALKISIYYHTQFSCNRDTYGWSKDSTTSTFLLAAIMPFASRFRELELDSPDNIYSIFETALSSCILTNLEKLKVSLKDPYIKYNNLSLPQNLFGDAPSLRCVSMNRLPDKNINSLRTNTSWRNLTSLSIFFGCTQHQVMILLERCPNLHRAHFRIVDDNASSFAEFANDVILPNLKYLWIIEERISNRPGDDMVYNGLYKYIHAPRLQYLQCRGSRELEPSAASLELFLKRSTQLERFSFCRALFSQTGIRTIIRTISAGFLTKLILRSCYQEDSFQHDYHYRWTEEQMDPFDLSWLIVKHNPDYNGSADLFLPHLEEFEIYDTMASDTTALEFITSRLNPLSHVAVLKSVLIYFNRAKGPDKIEIQELAEAHAVHAGVSLKLHLKYLPPTLELRNPFNFVPPAVHFPLSEPFGSPLDDFSQEYASG